jgi:hypothetical protein
MIAWMVYLVPVLVLFLLPARRPAAQAPAPDAVPASTS